MTTEEFKSELRRFKGKTIDDKLIAKMARAMQEVVREYLSNTGFEIWNAGCRLRLKSSYAGEKDFEICQYDNPLHAEREYTLLDNALKYMEKDDEG